MFASARPLLHASSSGGINTATPCASGPKRSFPAASSASAGPYSCPLRHTASFRLLDGGCWAPRSAAGANSPSAVESNASTLAGTALLTAQGLVNSYNGASRPTHVIDLPGSATASGHAQSEPFLSWDAHADPQQLAHTLDVRVPSAAAASAPLPPPSDSVNVASARHTVDPALAHQKQAQLQHASVSAAGGAAAAASSSPAAEAGSIGSPEAAASLAAVGSAWAAEDTPRPLPDDSDAPQPEASTSAPATATRQRRKAGTGRRAAAAATASSSSAAAAAGASDGDGGGSAGAGAEAAAAPVMRRGRGRPRTRPAPSEAQDAGQQQQQEQPPAAAAVADADASDSQAEAPRTREQQQRHQSQPSPQHQSQPQRRGPPPRPRLKPPPPPQSWPDYPYTRRPAATAVTPGDEAAAKLEALFQCVLHAPRLPARLLRFLRRAVPGGTAAALPLVTASVEGLSDVLGREMAMYLIRRRPWVVTVPAESIVPRMEAVRRLLGLAPPGVLDLLRKNPNLLRLEPATLRGRYEALYRSTGFDAAQVRALVHKYPLILNFHPESVESAALALRRLCSARPSWAAHHQLLSPSQFAAFLRDRVQVLLRLEYLLLTGGGGGCTLRDIIKTSNNSFKRTHSGFRNWMFERLRRLRERLARARAAAAAEGRLVSAAAAAEVEEAATREYEQEETSRLVRELGARRQEQRAELVRREAQSRATIEERIRQERLALAQAAGAELGAEPGGSDAEDDEEDEAEAGQRRRGRAGDYWAGDGEDEAEWERQRQQQYQQQQALLRQRYQQQQYQQQRAAGGPYGARPRGDGGSGGDYLATVTPGRHAWSRPGAKVPPEGPQPQRQRQHPGGAGGGRYPQPGPPGAPQQLRGQPRQEGGQW